MCRAGVSCAQLGLRSPAAETLSVDMQEPQRVSMYSPGPVSVVHGGPSHCEGTLRRRPSRTWHTWSRPGAPPTPQPSGKRARWWSSSRAGSACQREAGSAGSVPLRRARPRLSPREVDHLFRGQLEAVAGHRAEGQGGDSPLHRVKVLSSLGHRV